MSAPLVALPNKSILGTVDDTTYNALRLWALNAFTVRNLRARNNQASPDTKVDISCDLARLQYTSAGITYPAIAQGVDLSLDSAAVGAGGLDSGALGAHELWHLYLIGQDAASSGVISPVSLLASKSATSPTMPGSYTHRRRVSWAWTDASSHFVKFHHDGAIWKFDERQTAASGSASVARTTASLAGFVPGFCRQAFVRMQVESAWGADGVSYLYAKGANLPTLSTVDCDYGEEGQVGSWVAVPTLEIDYEVSATGTWAWSVLVESVLAPIHSEEC